MTRLTHLVPPALAKAGVHAKPVRPINHLTAEIWEDYRVFKAAGLLFRMAQGVGGVSAGILLKRRETFTN
jgi:hypothetical protein